jgi:hypothetical protein
MRSENPGEGDYPLFLGSRKSPSPHSSPRKSGEREHS